MDIKHKDLIYRAIHYIKRHSCERITLEDVAKYAGFSPSYFSKIFKGELPGRRGLYKFHTASGQKGSDIQQTLSISPGQKKRCGNQRRQKSAPNDSRNSGRQGLGLSAHLGIPCRA